MISSIQLTFVAFLLFFETLLDFIKEISLKNIYYNIIYFRKNRQYRKWQKAIYNGILDKNQEKIKFLKVIASEIKKEKYRIQTSKFIPLTRKNKAEIKAMVEGKHHREMKVLGIKLSTELQFV